MIRDAEWLVKRVDRTPEGAHALTVVGLSELVRDQESIFLDNLDSPQVIDPVKTELVVDDSPQYRASLLYMESLLRQTPPTDDKLYIGHRAAMDAVPYQLDPALLALQQPRQRILIADAVGLGKTLEAGILLAELIKRGRGKRILVVAVKSMLTQFQKELWSRFTIPLVRLDSVGIQRIRRDIPANHNPFYFYDKTIISVDTLKQDSEYRTFIENAYWDIIVIDEAHNVAERGTNSLRARLARLLAERSDTLIMLSATPHDGKARSFASLMNMLNPTAIANPDDYAPADIKGLFIRRFKKDIQHQVTGAFQERVIATAHAEASALEEAAFAQLANLQFTRLDGRRGGSMLFKTVLEKALLSSPRACRQTINHRIKTLRKRSEDYAEDIESLEQLDTALEQVTPEHFAKYQKLLSVLKDGDFAWTADDKTDRLVIFTERIETLRFLEEQLAADLKLKEEQIAVLHGGLSDVDQQRIVEAFGQDEAPVRLLLASDVASEGINLHYLSHRMIHFDVPWSLMVFQQRNGRIDRYGQEKQPRILYLVTRSANEKIKGDTRILELLIKKDEEAVKNIGDPSALMGVYDIEAEERKTADAIEQGISSDAFEESLVEKPDLLALLMAGPPPAGTSAAENTRELPSLFSSDFAYLDAALKHLQSKETLDVRSEAAERRIELTAPDELQERFKLLPREVRAENDYYVLSADVDRVQEEIRRCRKDESAWPRVQYLWDLHPIVQWANDKVLASFTRFEAPVIQLAEGLDAGESLFLLSGLIPNRKSHPIVHRWFGVRFIDGRFDAIQSLETVLSRTMLGQIAIPNRGQAIDTMPLEKLLPEAIAQGRQWMHEERDAFNQMMMPRLNGILNNLLALRRKKYARLELDFAGKKDRLSDARYQEQYGAATRSIEKIFDSYTAWIKDTLKTEDAPYLQVVAVLIKG